MLHNSCAFLDLQEVVEISTAILDVDEGSNFFRIRSLPVLVRHHCIGLSRRGTLQMATLQASNVPCRAAAPGKLAAQWQLTGMRGTGRPHRCRELIQVFV